MWKEGLQSRNVNTKRKVSVANLDRTVWVRLIKFEVILLDNRFTINLALHAQRRKREQTQGPSPHLQLYCNTLAS